MGRSDEVWSKAASARERARTEMTRFSGAVNDLENSVEAFARSVDRAIESGVLLTPEEIESGAGEVERLSQAVKRFGVEAVKDTEGSGD